MDKTAQVGDEVTINITGRLSDNTLVLLTEEGVPFTFTVGDSTIFKKVNSSVIGMKVGEKKLITLTPQEGFGEINRKLFATVPVKNLPSDIKAGTVVFDKDKDMTEWTVKEVSGRFAVLDGNHPLAGQELMFDIELVSISDDPKVVLYKKK